MSDLIYVLIILVCIVISAFFSGSETALFRLRSHQIEKEIESAQKFFNTSLANALRKARKIGKVDDFEKIHQVLVKARGML